MASIATRHKVWMCVGGGVCNGIGSQRARGVKEIAHVQRSTAVLAGNGRLTLPANLTNLGMHHAHEQGLLSPIT